VNRQESTPIIVIGGGLAGSEAAWQIGRRGYRVQLYEMKPQRFSPAHKSPLLAELVCSNSLGSDIPKSAPGLLKAELRALDSLIMAAAVANRVPAGRALAVAREGFSAFVEEKLAACPHIEIIREEVTGVPKNAIVVIAAGPLCSEALAAEIAKLTGAAHLHFYDAISPIIDGESLDYSRMFWASRYEADGSDYLNIPLSKEEYEAFHRELSMAESVPLHDFESPRYFEGCLPLEVIASRGIDTLRFGAMKPVGIRDSRSNEQPYALVQLRREDAAGRLFNIVGFQSKLKWGEQKRVFSQLPGLRNVVFVRFGAVHRNTFIASPLLLTEKLALRSNGNIFFAGQITGVEGYVESTAMGLLAGLNALALARGKDLPPPSPVTATGALIRYITSWQRDFQPMGINFGLLPPLTEGDVRGRGGGDMPKVSASGAQAAGGSLPAVKVRKSERGALYAQRALAALADFSQNEI